ncbi:MAG: hypothetical protein QOI66_1670 [Myxococcales bacterium]|jgi:hypothetical protein|nr:hypothetical protein [Myxococcales bacterium]
MNRSPWFSLLSVSAAVLSLANCSSGGGAGPPGGSGGNGGNGMTATLPYQPCPAATAVGHFSIALAGPTANAQGTSTFQGNVRNGVAPLENWPEIAKEGDCHVIVLPKLFCATACGSAQTCAGKDQCVPQPQAQDLGDIVLDGLAAPLTVQPIGAVGARVYYAELSTPFPPLGPESDVRMKTAGGAYPSFTLVGRGVEPLTFSASNLLVARDKPLVVTWTASAPNRSTKIFIRLDIAHHGNIGARLECDVADTGTATLPATLLAALIDQGTAGFPAITLIRRTMDAVTIAPGCVDFAVASPVEQDVMVEGVTSCNDDMPCPAGKTCDIVMKCK